jgi:hypothetical protein
LFGKVSSLQNSSQRTRRAQRFSLKLLCVLCGLCDKEPFLQWSQRCNSKYTPKGAICQTRPDGDPAICSPLPRSPAPLPPCPSAPPLLCSFAPLPLRSLAPLPPCPSAPLLLRALCLATCERNASRNLTQRHKNTKKASVSPCLCVRKTLYDVGSGPLDPRFSHIVRHPEGVLGNTIPIVWRFYHPFPGGSNPLRVGR